MAPINQLRRSRRLGTSDSNGRDYLADCLGWTRSKLEAWLYSPSVRPHLQFWHHLCIKDRERYNDAVEWINTGPKGYFYNEADLEEDLLLKCLCAGNDGVDKEPGDDKVIDYADQKVDTSGWITQELWARTAWRIIQENCGEGGMLEGWVDKHAAAAYGFAVEILCIMFHSVAFRGKWSVYAPLLEDWKAEGWQAVTVKAKGEVTRGSEYDDEEASDVDADSNSTTETADHSSDATFTANEEDEGPPTPVTAVSARPRGLGGRVADKIDGTIVVKPGVQQWVDGVEECEEDPTDVGLVDGDGALVIRFPARCV